MATTAIAMRTKDTNGTTGTTTINYVNPEATSSQLQSLASAFNDLTTNEMVDVTRIDKQVLGSEIEKLPRNMKLYLGSNEKTTLSAADLGTDVTAPEAEYQLKYDGAQDTDIVYVYYQPSTNSGEMVFLMYETPSVTRTGWDICIAKGADGTDYTGKLLFYMPATDTYAAETLEIPVTN